MAVAPTLPVSTLQRGASLFGAFRNIRGSYSRNLCNAIVGERESDTTKSCYDYCLHGNKRRRREGTDIEKCQGMSRTIEIRVDADVAISFEGF